MMHWMQSLVVIATLFNTASAAEWRLLDVERLDVEYHKLNPNNRDPYAPDYTGKWADRAALKWDISILNYGYWRNNVHTETLQSGIVKTVGWEWEAGLSLGEYLEVFHYHHSRHIMDEPPQRADHFPGARNQFPVEDSYGIRFKFIHKDK